MNMMVQLAMSCPGSALKPWGWVAAAALGILLLAAGLAATSVLRGWPPATGVFATQVLEATRPGNPSFVVTDCLAWTVNRHVMPRADETSGSATETIVACRSRSSFVRWLSIYGMATVTAGLIAMLAIRWRRREPSKVVG